METLINQIVVAFFIAITFTFYLYCVSKKEIPTIEMVLKICSRCLLVIVAMVFISLPFYPPLIDWLNQAPIPLTIAGLLILTSVIQSIWTP